MRGAVAISVVVGVGALMTFAVVDGCSPSPLASDGGQDTGVLDARSDVADAAPCEGAPQDNPNNCGSCGHSCLGGGCVAGQCQPVVVDTGQAPTAVAVDSTNLYWAYSGTGFSATGSIWKVALSGGSPVELASKQLDPWAIAVDATNVYWADDLTPGGNVSTVPIVGGQVSALASPDADCVTLTLTDTDVIWSQYPGGIFRMAKDGGGATLLYPSLASGLVSDNTNLYWTAESSPNGGIELITLGGDAGNTQLVGGQDLPLGITLRAGVLYWTNLGLDAGSIAMMPVDGGTPNTLAGAQQHPVAIATDDTYVYFCNIGSQTANDGSVSRVPLAGGQVTVLASNQGSPTAIAVDAASIYWANKRDGTIMRLAK